MNKKALVAFVSLLALTGIGIAAHAGMGVDLAKRYCGAIQDQEAAECDRLYPNDNSAWNKCVRESMDRYYDCVARNK